MGDARWYRDGLRFECTGCGRCCMHGDGYVWIAEAEIVALAAHLAMELDDFGRRYLRRVGDRYAFVDGHGGECVFLSGRTCSIYEFRPAQCRAFPWWPANLESPESWSKAADACEGISGVAPVVVAEAIDEALAVARHAGLASRGDAGARRETGAERSRSTR